MSVTALKDLVKRHFCGPVQEGAVNFRNFYANLRVELEKILNDDPGELDVLRCKFLLYRCDLDTSDAVKQSILDLCRSLFEQSTKDDVDLLLELANVVVNMEDEQLSTEVMAKCRQLLNFDYHLSGFMGMKSRHQDKPCAFLMTKIVSANPKPYSTGSAVDCNIPLEDEDLFDAPQVTDADTTIVGERECALLLINAMFVDKFETRDDASAEKIDAFVMKVLECTDDWAVQRQALYIRSLNEAKRAKYAERSMRQLEALLNACFTDVPELTDRCKMFHSLCLPDLFALKKDVALSLARHGQHLRAATMLRDLHMVNQAAVCLINGGRKEEAAELLTVECDENADPTALCLLGDLMGDEQYYTKAWNASKMTFFPALRALGLSQYRRNDFAAAQSSFAKLTVANPSVVDNWYLLGCCQLQQQQWTDAVDSFTRVIAADHDHSQAWNNMAAIHLHLNNLEAAQHALKMSARLEFDAWRIWDNLFRVSLRLGDLFECVLACQRLLELRGREGGFAPFLALMNRLSSETSLRADDPKMQSLCKSIDCLVGWMDKLFGDDHDYLWLKSEYLLIRGDKDGRLECCLCRHRLLLSLNDHSNKILDALSDNLATIRDLSTDEYEKCVCELPMHIPSDLLPAIHSKFPKH